MGSGRRRWGADEASWAVVGIKKLNGYPGLDMFLAYESRCSVNDSTFHGAPTVHRNSNSRFRSLPGPQAAHLDGCECAVHLSHFAECPRTLGTHNTCCSYSYWQVKKWRPRGAQGHVWEAISMAQAVRMSLSAMWPWAAAGFPRPLLLHL